MIELRAEDVVRFAREGEGVTLGSAVVVHGDSGLDRIEDLAVAEHVDGRITWRAADD